MNSRFKIAAAFVAGALACGTAWASEGAMYGGPVGGSDIGSAYLPPVSGFYMATLVGGGIANKDYQSNGQLNPYVKTHDRAGGAALALLYVYPVQIAGGTIASAVEDAYWTGRFEFNGKAERYSGMGDIYADVIEWSKYLGPIGESKESDRPTLPLPYGLAVKVAYSMILSTGKYDATKFHSSGFNVNFFIPNVAATYLTGPNALGDGLELSARVFLDFASFNHTTHYSSGPVGDIDVAATERRGKWQVGLAGFYARQWRDDVVGGQTATSNGNRLLSAGVGPVVAYDLPQWGANLKLKVTAPVATRNSLGLGSAFLVFSKAL
ncbi:MAG: hypothetical protein JWQ11_4189 [Rhizobacter sp.]|nr:hypothetical protein [Rhizobacter sp.]